MTGVQFSSAAPCFAVADVGATMRWYQERLGFTCHPFPPTEPHAFAVLSRDRVEIMLQRIEDYEKPDLYSQRSGGVWDAYIRINGVKELFEALRNEVTILRSLCQQPYGDWEFEVKDPNGYVLVFSELFE
jgi:uncharacterized glyoxalase superfamily protein PhnB